ncbi:MAG: recombinase family protein [Aeriscardovia sp.]|nr:recombinase family protein [Aeriscardovia sp.]
MDSERAAIYHFTNGIPKNAYCKNEIQKLVEYATSQGYEDVDTFCDIRTTSEEHEALDKLLENRNMYSAIIAKDYFHINKYILQALSIVNNLENSGITVLTMDNRPLHIEDTAPLKQPLRAVTYHCHWYRHKDILNVNLKNDILNCFAETQTNWSILEQYYDEEQKGHAGIQPELNRMIEKKDNFDIIIIHSLSSLHWRTHNFCEIQERLGKSIYSLQDGYLPFMR